MNYNEMSDFEINKAVAKAVGRMAKTEFDSGFIGFTKSYHEMYPSTVWTAAVDAEGYQCEAWEQTDYCNDPSDAWPIIELLFSQGITLIMNDTGVMTNNAGVKFNGKSFDVEGSPLRAAMIVYLTMQEQSDEY